MRRSKTKRPTRTDTGTQGSRGTRLRACSGREPDPDQAHPPTPPRKRNRGRPEPNRNPLPQIGRRVIGTRVLLSTVSGGRRVNILVDLDELAKGRVETLLTITRPYDEHTAARLRTAETQYLHQIAQRIAP